MVIEKAVEYCRKTLQKVSRSFALTIPLVEKNILIPITVGYLEARILDSFEDGKGASAEQVRRRIDCMNSIITILEKPDDNDIDKKLRELSAASQEFISNPHYAGLVQNMDMVLTVHKSMDPRAQSAILTWFSEMNRGMQKYLNKPIDTFQELDEYCYYVAGTVGGLTTELLLHNATQISQEQTTSLMALKNDCGLLLQKTNIIRDVREDILQNEKIFWPAELFREHALEPTQLLDPQNQERAMQILHKMLANAERHILPAYSYVAAIPETFPGYRKFSAINFQMAAETLVKIRNNPNVFYSQQPVKIDRSTRNEILADPVGRLERVLTAGAG